MMAEQLSAEKAHQQLIQDGRSASTPGVCDDCKGPSLALLKPSLGNVGRILAISWEDLGATWVHLGACNSLLDKYILC